MIKHLMYKSHQASAIMIRLFGLFLLATLLASCAEPPYYNLNNEQLTTKLEQNIPVYDIRQPDRMMLNSYG